MTKKTTAAAAKSAPEIRSFPLTSERRSAILSAVRSKFSEQVEKARSERGRSMREIALRFVEAHCPPEVLAIFKDPALRGHLDISRAYCGNGIYLHVPDMAWGKTDTPARLPYEMAAQEAEARYDAAQKPIDEAIDALAGVLMSCSTSKKAIEQLPELKTLIEAQSPYQAQTSGGLVVYGAADAAISKLVSLGMKLPV